MDKSQKQILISQVKEKLRLIKPYLSQDELRIWAAVESISIGRGGNIIIHEATGISRATIDKGKKEVELNKSGKKTQQPDRGRKRLLEKHPKLLRDLDGLIYPFEHKEPVPTLRWTQDSTYEIKRQLEKKGYKISQKTVYSIMLAAGYIMHSNQKKISEKSGPHFGMQFDYIHEKVKEYRGQGFPAVSLELQSYTGSKDDFTLQDLMASDAWGYTALDSNTIKITAESIQKWWVETGKKSYPDAGGLLIIIDGSRSPRWDQKIQDLSNSIGMPVQVCHFPPGIRKWDNIVSQTYSFIVTKTNEKSVGFCSIVSVVSPAQNLRESVDISEAPLKTEKINMTEDIFKGEWNYMISPFGD
nr:hypothetical protein [uncultured Desulfobacter sp.]